MAESQPSKRPLPEPEPPSPLELQPEPTHFPFEASPGEAGITPTNELVNALDHDRHSTEEPDQIGALPLFAVPTLAANSTAINTHIITPNITQDITLPSRNHSNISQSSQLLQSSENIEPDGTPLNKTASTSRFMNRLKGKVPKHSRSFSWSIDHNQFHHRQNSDLDETVGAEDGDDEDEDPASAPIDVTNSTQTTTPKRKARRFNPSSFSTPSTIKIPRFRRVSTDMPSTPMSRTFRFGRANTMSNLTNPDRGAFSDDDRNVSTRRNNAIRRLTGIRTPKGDQIRNSTTQKWRQLKASLKMLRKKDDRKIDQVKSAELIAELQAITPAVMMMFSMFLRDDNDKQRIPVLFEQLKIRVTDSIRQKGESSDRHVTFRIELEYASALPKMKWVIHRNWYELARLHRKYKKPLSVVMHPLTERTKLPKFPGKAIPYLRNIRGLYDEDDEEEEPELPALMEQISVPESTRPNPLGGAKRIGSAFGQPLLRLGSTFGLHPPASSTKDQYAESVRKKIETYLQQLMYAVMFRPDSNHLCRFLELSALSIKLAAEGSYHGKEGRLIIKSSKGVDFRKSLRPSLFYERHKPKWFLVRHSYIACVDSPESLVVYDLFFVDSHFKIEARYNFSKSKKGWGEKSPEADPEEFPSLPGKGHSGPVHQLTISNGERTTKLLARTGRLLLQFEDSIKCMLSTSEWAKSHRFDSFAPVRHKAWALPLVDGQDYFWNVSRAISNAKDVIYIHDWWLSPEVFLRRPACISKIWRLDRLLKLKADQGVKIFVIVYRNVESAIPINSEYTKHTLHSLSPNIIVQRSPHQLKQKTFFWAHHEKIVVVDHTVAFVGGIDLCFGRWDTPSHPLNDDKLIGFETSGDEGKTADNCQLWPGKDYSNPREHDFFDLPNPFHEMYNREVVPRMPWHDVAVQMVGQPARDLSRHFAQRWNFLLRQRQSLRPRPLLIPPPDLDLAELKAMGLSGECEIQVLRSAAAWSSGLRHSDEHSIMNAYVKSIRLSHHLVYIENQFFITSCEFNETPIRNQIGDALVSRIKKAAELGEKWRAIIVIPLVPGFQSKVDKNEGTSVRLIMAAQYYSICRGETSIFGRLQSEGINPTDYIEFYALRKWGHIGPAKTLVTEQLYIHAKIMVVDDRIAIIGSANINERSMLGERDSEVAVIIEDRDMMDSRLGGERFQVGRFAHELRVKLMREHLGVDVSRPPDERFVEAPLQSQQPSTKNQSGLPSPSPSPTTTPHSLDKPLITSAGVTATHKHVKAKQSLEQLMEFHRAEKNIIGSYQNLGTGSSHYGSDNAASSSNSVGPVSNSPPKLQQTSPKEISKSKKSNTDTAILPPLPEDDDIEIGGPPKSESFSNALLVEQYPQLADMKFPIVEPASFEDPVDGAFFREVWHTVAENNTRCFRMVFRCQPDSDVKTWDEYEAWDKFYEEFKVSQHSGLGEREKEHQNAQGQSDTVATAPAEKEFPLDPEKTYLTVPGPSDMSETGNAATTLFGSRTQSKRIRKLASAKSSPKPAGSSTTISPRIDHTDDPTVLNKEAAEEVLGHITGNLVLWPYEWLAKEVLETKSIMDKISPLEIYI